MKALPIWMFLGMAAAAAPEVAVRGAPSNDPGLRMAIDEVRAALGSGDRHSTRRGAEILDVPAGSAYRVVLAIRPTPISDWQPAEVNHAR